MFHYRPLIHVFLLFLMPILFVLTWTRTITAGGVDGDSPVFKAVPSAASLMRAKKIVREAFHSRYLAASTDEQKAALAADMLEVAKRTRDDAAGQYALLETAGSIAAEAGDISLLFDAIDATAERFTIDGLLVKSEAIMEITESLRDTSQTLTTRTAIENLCAAAIDAERYELATRLTEFQEQTARKIRAKEWQSEATTRSKHIEEMARLHAAATLARNALEQTPDAKRDNTALGVYLCLVRGDWKAGLPYLANGSDPGLSELAGRELASPQSATDKKNLADTWWDRASGETDFLARACQRRAVYWYQNALARLTGLNKELASARIGELEEETDVASASEARSDVEQSSYEIVIWNSFNGEWGDRGAETVNLILFNEQKPVFEARDVKIEWEVDQPSSVTILIPKSTDRFNRLRVVVTKCHGRSAALAEIQLLRAGRNLALGCPGTTNSKYRAPYGLPTQLTDGITTDTDANQGYWLHDKGQGWVEIYLRGFVNPGPRRR